MAVHTATDVPIDPIKSATALVPLIRSHADQIEQDGALPAAVLDAFIEAGLFKLLAPRSLGGGEADPLSMLTIIETLAAADGSAAWCVAVAAVCGVVGAFLDEETAWEIFAKDRGACLVGSSAPAGTTGERRPSRAVETGDGYQVTGRWAFASGCLHATWLLGVCPVFDGEEPRLQENGEPEMVVLFMPRAGCQIEDTWHVTGLRGTGSHTFSVADVWVPRSHSLSPGELHARETGTLYAFAPGFGFSPGGVAAWANPTKIAFAAVGLGIARGALDAFAALAESKKPHGSPEPLSDQPRVQEQVGRAESTWRAAHAYLKATARQVWDAAAESGTTTTAQQIRLHVAASHSVELAAQVVDMVWNLAGTSAIVDGGAFDRRFRDIHTLSQNRGVSSRAFGFAGKLLLGRENYA